MVKKIINVLQHFLILESIIILWETMKVTQALVFLCSFWQWSLEKGWMRNVFYCTGHIFFFYFMFIEVKHIRHKYLFFARPHILIATFFSSNFFPRDSMFTTVLWTPLSCSRIQHFDPSNNTHQIIYNFLRVTLLQLNPSCLTLWNDCVMWH